MDFYDSLDCRLKGAKVIEIENNRLYINGVFKYYAAHSLHDTVDGNCYISFSHRHGRNLVCVDGKAWLGDNDGTMPSPDIVVGSVVSLDGLLPDPSAMVVVMEHIQTREDDGLNTRIKVK